MESTVGAIGHKQTWMQSEACASLRNDIEGQFKDALNKPQHAQDIFEQLLKHIEALILKTDNTPKDLYTLLLTFAVNA